VRFPVFYKESYGFDAKFHLKLLFSQEFDPGFLCLAWTKFSRFLKQVKQRLRSLKLTKSLVLDETLKLRSLSGWKLKFLRELLSFSNPSHDIFLFYSKKIREED